MKLNLRCPSVRKAAPLQLKPVAFSLLAKKKLIKTLLFKSIVKLLMSVLISFIELRFHCTLQSRLYTDVFKPKLEVSFVQSIIPPPKYDCLLNFL